MYKPPKSIPDPEYHVLLKTTKIQQTRAFSNIETSNHQIKIKIKNQKCISQQHLTTIISKMSCPNSLWLFITVFFFVFIQTTIVATTLIYINILLFYILLFYNLPFIFINITFKIIIITIICIFIIIIIKLIFNLTICI